jgi:hypothetical protein
MTKGANEQAGDNDEHDAERHLRHDEDARRPAAGCSRDAGAARFGEHPSDIRSAGLKRGKQAEHDAGTQRRGRRDEQHAKIRAGWRGDYTCDLRGDVLREDVPKADSSHGTAGGQDEARRRFPGSPITRGFGGRSAAPIHPAPGQSGAGPWPGGAAGAARRRRRRDSQTRGPSR